MTSSPKAIFFLGATGGCAFAALVQSLAAGYKCIALCRDPSRLTAKLSPEQQQQVQIRQGNAHDAEVVRSCLVHPSDPSRLVDHVVSSIGNPMTWEGIIHPDRDVCSKGMVVLLGVIAELRKQGVTGRPRTVAVSSTGLSEIARDVPLAMVPLYRMILAPAHRDKRGMEAALFASGEDWTVVRPSALTGGEGGKRPVRAGLEDPVARTVESKAVGYTISREDVGRWVFDNIIDGDKRDDGGKWVQRVATVTY